jgi:hypothetical protein
LRLGQIEAAHHIDPVWLVVGPLSRQFRVALLLGANIALANYVTIDLKSLVKTLYKPENSTLKCQSICTRSAPSFGHRNPHDWQRNGRASYKHW